SYHSPLGSFGFRGKAGQSLADVPPVQKEEYCPNHVSTLPANYWPASILAVIKPTLSTPAECAISITWATSLNVRSGSALTNITFSARVLKMSFKRPSRLSHVTSSWLILSAGLSPPPFSTCTTIVRSLGGGCFCWSLGGWGTSASRPFGVSGVITIKMMSSTSNTSISGVTLMSADGPPDPPIAIPISNSCYWAPAPVVGGFLPAAPVCICSVNRPTSSTPAERTLSTTSTTLPYLARASDLMNTRLSTLLARRSFTLAVRSSALIRSVPK